MVTDRWTDVPSEKGKPLRVGMALKKEKSKKHITETLVKKAAESNIELVQIDEEKSLEKQGPFDIILQKIRREEWEQELEKYIKKYPGVAVVDPPHKTHVLRNRGSMLTPLHGQPWVFTAPSNWIKEPGCLDRAVCEVPDHITIDEGTSYPDALQQLKESGLHFPVVAKGLWADGRPGSHNMAVVYTEAGFRKIVEHSGNAEEGMPLPVLIEQYIEHGTCLFKIYVMGESQIMVTRPSLSIEDKVSSPATPLLFNAMETERSKESLSNGRKRLEGHPKTQDTSTDDLIEISNPSLDIEMISRVSAYPRSRSYGKGDLAPRGHGVPKPPEWLWRELSVRLRDALGIRLFNFDIIVPTNPPEGYRGLLESEEGKQVTKENREQGLIYLIDINYFPGIEKLPDYEKLMVNFLQSIENEK